MDSQQDAYRVNSFGRASWWTLLNPWSIWKYLGLMIRGVLPGTPGADIHQLGGDVLVDPAGVLRMRFASTSPHDRPSLDSVLQIVRDWTPDDPEFKGRVGLLEPKQFSHDDPRADTGSL